ncbi:hypothetical protein FHT44_005066 [Mycolicibacterium sp. BK634]|nr:hypothetical protein [Mycolicibacterium sp. BK634]
MRSDGETNYSWTRERLGLEQWDCDREATVYRTPSNAELLELLDALHADFAGVETPAFAEELRGRWYRS